MSAPAGAVPVQVEHLYKRFDRTTALDDISLEVRAGEIFGLVGPNGAGKTTLIRTILDVIKPDSGRVAIFGHPFQPADRDRIGYLPEERGLYPRQPVGRVLGYLAALKGLPAARTDGEIHRWLDRLELADAVNKKVEQLSKGNQQKVQIAATLIAGSPVVILDEPLSGLDPVSARLVNSVIREYAVAGHTVILSTHQMNLVESLCSRVFMIAHGQRVLYGDIKTIKREHASHEIRVLSDADYRACPLVTGVTDSLVEDEPVTIALRDGTNPDEFLIWLSNQHANVRSFERMTMPLEDIFVHVARQAALNQRAAATTHLPPR